MQRFMRSAVEVLAFQWKGQPETDWPAWAQEAAEGGQHGQLWRNGSHLSIDSPSGPKRVNLGGWVVKGKNGLEAVTEEEFADNYRPLDTGKGASKGKGTKPGAKVKDPPKKPESKDESDDEDESDDTDEDEADDESDDESDDDEKEDEEDSGDDSGTKTEVPSSSDSV